MSYSKSIRICMVCQKPVLGNKKRKFCGPNCKSVVYRGKHPERMKRINRIAHKPEDPEKARERAREWYQENRLRATEAAKLYYSEHRQEMNEKSRAYRKKHKERLNVLNKTYRVENPEKGREAKQKRRALKNGVDHVPYKRKEIFDRDEYVCWICGEKTDTSKKFPHPDSPSLDHVIPLSGGGPDCSENVACAHLGCNLKKNDRKLTLF